MSLSEIDRALVESEALFCLRRTQLVSLCKRHGLKPKGGNKDMAVALRELILATPPDAHAAVDASPSADQSYSLLYTCVEQAESVKSASSSFSTSFDKENVPTRQAYEDMVPSFKPYEDTIKRLRAVQRKGSVIERLRDSFRSAGGGAARAPLTSAARNPPPPTDHAHMHAAPSFSFGQSECSDASDAADFADGVPSVAPTASHASSQPHAAGSAVYAHDASGVDRMRLYDTTAPHKASSYRMRAHHAGHATGFVPSTPAGHGRSMLR